MANATTAQELIEFNQLTKLKYDLTHFHIYDFDNFSEFLQKNNAVISGGTVLNAVCPFKNTNYSDDIDLYTIDDPQIYENTIKYIESLGYKLHNQSKNDYEGPSQFSEYINCVYNYVHPIHKTIIQYIVISVEPIVHLKTFDIPACSTYYDGSYVIKNPYEIDDYYSIDFLTKKIKEIRFDKYVKRGFKFNCAYEFE